MDADKFAVNAIAEQLIGHFNEREEPANDPFGPFLKNEQMVVRYCLFMLHCMFYFFSHKKKFERYFLDHPHPHPALRWRHSSELLLVCFKDNDFISEEQSAICYRQSFLDFINAMKRLFHDSPVLAYFRLATDADLMSHHESIIAATKDVPNLNGTYIIAEK